MDAEGVVFLHPLHSLFRVILNGKFTITINFVIFIVFLSAVALYGFLL